MRCTCLLLVTASAQLIIGTGVVFASQTDGDEYMSSCRQDLGMNSGAIPDSAITASSAYDVKSVGPLNSRIRTEKNGGAWCPRPQVGRDTSEWLEIDLGELKVVSLVETQGRFGNGQGQEFAPSYLLDYQRESGAEWRRFRDRTSTELLQGNSNTYLAELRELRPPIIARRIRFVPYSSHPRTVCMRVELYGCTWTDGLVSYNMSQGDRRGTEMDFYDFTYDGLVTDTQLSGGLGQLTDFEEGDSNFRLDLQNLGRKGYEWVGWRNDSTSRTSPAVEITFRFDQVRNFSAVILTANNMFSREVSVFRSARVFFSIGGIHFPRPALFFPHPRDDVVEYARQVAIPIVPGRVGRFIRLLLEFDLRWIMISEIRFVSERANGTFVVEEQPAERVDDDPSYYYSNPRSPKDSPVDDEHSGSMEEKNEVGEQTSSPDVIQVGRRQKLDDTYIGIIVGALAVFIILIFVLGIFLMIRLRRKKYGGSHGSPSKFVFAGAADQTSLNLTELTQSLPLGAKFSNGNAYNAVIIDSIEKNTSLCETNNRINSETSARERMLRDNINSLPPPEIAVRTDGGGTLYTSLAKSIPPPPPIPAAVTAVPSNGSCSLPRLTPSPPLPATYLYQPHEPVDSPDADAMTTDGEDVAVEACGRLPDWDNFSDLEFPRENLSLVEPFGVVSFGEILLCKALVPSYLQPEFTGTLSKRVARTELVVVKALHARASKRAQLDFYRETEIMIGLRDPHIVQVLGVCSRDEPIAVVFEYSEFGDLHQFLLSSLSEQTAVSVSAAAGPYRTLSYGSLIYMATQIASGMKYLESLNIVHRDLATRNCLVGHKYSVKISDFGMSRGLYSADYYRVEGKAVLPIRWMAWESVLLHRFSTKSDVWSFAVTLWEILTFARQRPFETLTDEQVIDNCGHCYGGDSLGIFLCQPPNCPREIYDLMVECWNREQTQRPTFREIHMFLQRKNMGYSPTEDRSSSGDFVDREAFVSIAT